MFALRVLVTTLVCVLGQVTGQEYVWTQIWDNGNGDGHCSCDGSNFFNRNYESPLPSWADAQQTCYDMEGCVGISWDQAGVNYLIGEGYSYTHAGACGFATPSTMTHLIATNGCFCLYVQRTCTATEVANSDRATTGAITGNSGDTVLVTCDPGYSGTGTMTCDGNTGAFTSLTCLRDCTATEVANSDYATSGSIAGAEGDTVTVACDLGYSGGGAVTCNNDGNFDVVTCTADACSATEVANSDFSATGSVTGTTGDTVTITCSEGYDGSGVVTCGTDGNFDTLTCTEQAGDGGDGDEAGGDGDGNTLFTTELMFWNPAAHNTPFANNVTGLAIYISCLFAITGAQ